MQQKILKRWLCAVVLLCGFVTAQSQSLKKVEYFFDTDPGAGNGLSILIPSSPSLLDSTFTFDVSSLANGLHTIYIRVQDDGLHWSLDNAFSFIKTSGSSGVLGVQKLEYFFDTDPGVGNGTTLNVTPNNLIDSTFSFNVSALNNGLHIIYVRAIDVNGNVSLNYTTSFVKAIGNDSLLTVNKLEYFLDIDPGFGNGFNVPIQQAPVLNDTFNFQIPDNGADARRLYIRAKDNRGEWSLLYDSTISLCEIYKAKPNFSWIRFADLYSFIDSSQNNPTHKLLWNFDNLGIDSVSNPQFTFPQGHHSVKLIAGSGCRKDSITIPLYVGLEKYYPDTAYNGGDMVMIFFGGGLDTNLVVTLNNNAGTVISPYEKIATGLKAYDGLFDLHTAPAGMYDIHMHFSNGFDTTILSGLQVMDVPGNADSYDPDISIDIVGPDAGRPASKVHLQMIITNNGGMLAKSVPVMFTISGDDGMAINAPYNYRLNYAPPTTPSYNYVDSVPTTTGLDSLFGKPYHGQMQNFIIPYLNSGESFVMPLDITLPITHGDYIDVDAWNGKRMFGSPFRSKWGNCFDLVFDFVVGFVPGWSCVNSVYNYVAYGSSSVGNWAWNTFGTILSCIPGVNDVENLSNTANFLRAINHPKAFTDIAHNTASSLNGTESACDDVNDPNKKQQKRAHKRVAVDPNEISGPNGYATNNYINGTGKLGYNVSFENVATATANAQRVYVTDTVDKSKFDLRTFELMGYSIGDTFIKLPVQRKEYVQTLDLRPKMNLLLRFNAKLDTASGVLRYAFLSLDPVTRDTLSLSDLRGFLPPDTNDISGRGSVSYTVLAKKNLVTNDAIINKASIIFDNNAPIITNTWLNTIDKTAPTGTVNNGILINDTTVRLHLTGADVGAGVNRYKLYISEGQQPYRMAGNIYGDTVRFTGALDSMYRFYAVPFDSVNNWAPKAPTAEYTVIFSRPLSVNLLSFIAQKLQADILTNWQTASQTNFDHYEVERSLDANHFDKIGAVAANNVPGVLNYQFKDLNAVNIFKNNGRLFYRLKIVDKDRTTSYSRIVRVDFDKKYTVDVYPNPAQNEINVDGIQNYKKMQVSDASGKIVYSGNINQPKQTLNISNLQKGIYIIKLTGDDDIQSIKFLKK